MTVLHISGAQSWGGNEQQLIYLIHQLGKHGVQQKLFCFKDSPLYKEAKQQEVEIYATPVFSPYSSKYRRFLKNIIKTESIDLIHLHTSDSVTGYVLTDLFSPLKTTTLFARKGIRNKTGFLSKLKYNYKNIDGILCVSEYVKEHFANILSEKNKSKLVTVYDGVKVEKVPENADYKLTEKLNIPTNIFLIGNIANHTGAKDLPTLINVIDKLVNEKGIKDIHLVQIGEFSKDTLQLKGMVAEKGLEAYITFMGFVNSASTFLPQFDVFMITSQREGGPSSILEAFYYNTPVISTRVGIVDEVITDGENGFSTEIGDVSGLAERVEKFKNLPELHSEFVEKCHVIFLKKFTAEQMGNRTYEVYKNLINTKHR